MPLGCIRSQKKFSVIDSKLTFGERFFCSTLYQSGTFGGSNILEPGSNILPKSPKMKGMKRESSDKTRFCVSLEGLPNGLGPFSLPWFMFENKTKNMFLTRRGSNIMEPGRQYIGAHQIFFPKNDSYVWIYLLSHKWSLIRLNLSNMGLVRLNKGFSISHKFCLKIWQEGAPIYWGPGSIILEPRLQYIGAPSSQKHIFCFIFEHVSQLTKGSQSIW